MAAPTGPKKVHRYCNEFKIHAARLALHPEIQTQDVASKASAKYLETQYNEYKEILTELGLANASRKD